MFFEPGSDAALVEPVSAGKDGDLFAQLNGIHADGALCLALFIQHFFLYFALRQRSNCCFRGWAWGITTLALFHESRDHLIQCLLREDGISMSSVGWIHHVVQCPTATKSLED